MPNKIIKYNTIVDDEWLLVSDTTNIDIPTAKVIIPLAAWNSHLDALIKQKELPGLLLNCEDNPADFNGNISSLKLIVVNFPAFTDGRGFSIGNLLRDRYHYKGELRACGGFIRDQLYYLKRCGFDAFQFHNDINLDEALHSLNDFSDCYQTSSTQPSPLFLRRKSLT